MALNSYSDDNNQTYTIYCSRCGNEYSSDARYCMKCGNLNPDHPQNKKYSKFINNHMEGYTVGGGQVQVEVNKNEVTGNGVNISLGSNTGNFNTCFNINLLLYLLIMLGSGLFFAYTNNFDWKGILASNLYLVWIIVSVLYLLLYSVELVYMKMNKPWWSSLIPIYSNVVLADAVFKKPFIGVLTIIPIVGFIIQLVLWYKMGSKFKKSGLFTTLLPIIMFPIIGYGGSAFEGNCYVSGANSLEKEFKKKRTLMVCCLLFILISGAMYVYSNFAQLREDGKKSSKLYLVSSAKIIEKTMDKKIESGDFTCKSGSKEGTLYFYFRDISDQFFIPYGVFVDVMSASVRVEQSESGNKYYISITNGKDGFPETLSSEIDEDTVQEFTKIDESYKSVSCRFTS